MSIQKLLLSFEPQLDNLLPLLKQVNFYFGGVSKDQVYLIAEYFKLTPARVYGVVTASDVLKEERESSAKPKLEILVCDSPHCQSHGGGKIIKEIENYLNIKAERRFNPKVFLKRTSCMGHCDQGPVMMVNGILYTRVRPEKVDDILSNYI